jgi:hypothetical protein
VTEKNISFRGLTAIYFIIISCYSYGTWEFLIFYKKFKQHDSTPQPPKLPFNKYNTVHIFKQNSAYINMYFISIKENEIITDIVKKKSIVNLGICFHCLYTAA